MPSRKIILSLLFSICLQASSSIISAQNIDAYPSNWFVNMNYNKVQVLLRSTSSDFTKASVQVNYPGVALKKTQHFENGHYIAVDVEISPNAKPGNIIFAITSEGKTSNFNWPLLPRRKNRGTQFAQGLSSADLVYFLMPDRFSNGDPSNDKLPGLKDQSLNRGEIFLRHGGDLQGVQNLSGFRISSTSCFYCVLCYFNSLNIRY